jgi:hypothetical protein
VVEHLPSKRKALHSNPNTTKKKKKEKERRKLLCCHQWLTPTILATQEADIRRITVQSQPGK